jgi:acyl carrier protein
MDQVLSGPAAIKHSDAISNQRADNHSAIAGCGYLSDDRYSQAHWRRLKRKHDIHERHFDSTGTGDMTLSERVCSVIERETGQKVTASTPLDALHVDSLEFVSLMLEVGNEFSTTIPDSAMVDMKTVGDLILEVA